MKKLLILGLILLVLLTMVQYVLGLPNPQLGETAAVETLSRETINETADLAQLQETRDSLAVAESRLAEEATEKKVALSVLQKITSELNSAVKNEERLSEEKVAALEKIGILNTELSKETDAKTAALEKMRNLEDEFRAATAEIGALRAKIGKEAAAREATWSELQASWHYLRLAQEGEVKTGQDLAAINLKLGQSLRDYAYLYDYFRKTEELIWRIESYSLGDAKLNTGREIVKPVIFIPVDIQTPIELKDVLAVRRALGLTQIWFQNQLGITFSLEEPVVFKGKRSLKQYDALTPVERISAIRKEIGGTEAVVVFLYGSNDSWSWGSSWQRFALIGDNVYGLTISRDGILRYNGVWIIAHELGHVFGLPHGEDKPELIMAANFYGREFPLVRFTEQEKEILRRNLAR